MEWSGEADAGALVLPLLVPPEARPFLAWGSRHDSGAWSPGAPFLRHGLVVLSTRRVSISAGESLLDHSTSLTFTAGRLFFEKSETMTTRQELCRLCKHPTHLSLSESGVAVGHRAMRIVDGAGAVAHDAFLCGFFLHIHPFCRNCPSRVVLVSWKKRNSIVQRPTSLGHHDEYCKRIVG